MRFWSLLVWVTQFGFSVVFPPYFFLVLANWIQNQYDLGSWVVIVFGVLGLLTAVSTVRSCIRAMRKDAQRAAEGKAPPTAFNDHR